MRRHARVFLSDFVEIKDYALQSEQQLSSYAGFYIGQHSLRASFSLRELLLTNPRKNSSFSEYLQQGYRYLSSEVLNNVFKSFERIQLRTYPVVSVTEIKYYTRENDSGITIDSDKYSVDLQLTLPYITFNDTEFQDTDELRMEQTLTVDFMAGYDVLNLPPDIKQALLKLTAYNFENRQGEGDSKQLVRILSMVDAYKILEV